MGITSIFKGYIFSKTWYTNAKTTPNAAKEGFNVAKYVPYGPLKDVLPYLMRRAQENTSITGQIGRELSNIILEKKRREKY